MITPTHAQTMARYNRWQNDNLYSAAETLSDAERRKDRGAFFGSIHATFSHLLWADSTWFSRFAGWPKPVGGIKDSPGFEPDWLRLQARRRDMDEAIIAWADDIDQTWLGQDLVWYSGAAGREMRKSRALLVVHAFNHQTHHRGQIHAMLTAAGARPHDTDLMLLEGV